MSPEAPNPVDKKTYLALKLYSLVDDAASKASFPLFRWLARRKGVEMYRVLTLGEQQKLTRSLLPLFEDAIDIKIAEGDFSEGPLSSGSEFPPDTRVRITQVPKGNAPENIRRFWVGVEMDAYELTASLNEELVFTSGEPSSSTQRQTETIYAVKLEEALQSLERNSLEAARWFRDNLAPNIDALSFGSDEVEIVRWK